MAVLYHCMGARSFRPLWTLEELGLPYELTVLPFPPRVMDKTFLAINPLGTVPAFLDGDVLMTESVAICHYLVSCFGPTDLTVTPAENAYGAFLNWLHFGEATLTFPQTLILRYGCFEPEERRSPQIVDDYRRWFLARLRGVDAVVSKQPYLCADRFTVADVSVGYALMLATAIGLEQDLPAAVTAYWERLQTRPAYQRALEKQRSTAKEQGVAGALFP